MQGASGSALLRAFTTCLSSADLCTLDEDSLDALVFGQVDGEKRTGGIDPYASSSGRQLLRLFHPPII